MIVDNNMAMPTSPNDETGMSPSLKAPATFSDFLDGSALAPSPEHPTFHHGATQGWANPMDMGMNIDTKDFINPAGLPSEPNHWSDATSAIPSHSLSHVSSTSSLNSLFSMAPSNASLLVDLPEHLDPMSHSRHSSFSYENKGDGDDLMMGGWTMPVTTTPSMMSRDVPPPLALQTQGLGKVDGRQHRSMSRAMPYQRERSMSLQSEDEEVGALLSSTSTHSAYTPWSATMVNGLTKMSLHHRRTSSNTSAFSQKASPMRPSLSRAHRSGSLAISKRASIDRFADSQITGSAEERELTVRSMLGDSANGVKSAPAGTQQDKLRTLWVRQWLHLCYTECKGYTVPRQGLYASYAASCEEFGVKAINSASFGKAVRNAYPTIKTRRLGHRGNSKYHYVALRPSIRLEAMRLNEYGDSSGQWHVAPEDGAMDFRPQQGVDFEGEDVDETEIEEEDDMYAIRKTPSSIDVRASSARPITFGRRHTTASMPFSTFEATPVYSLPGFPSFSDVNLGTATGNAQAFWNAYIQHLELLAGYVRTLRFDQFEYQIRTFWAQRSPIDMEICQNSLISAKIDEGLAKAYDHFLSILLERLLSPLPQPAQNELRKLSGNLEAVIEQSMTNFSPEFCEPKIELSVRAGHLFNRYLDLYQISTALAPILSSNEQVRTMSHAWDRLDGRSIADQCALSCNCKPELLGEVLSTFQNWLQEVESMPSRGNKSIENLGKWIDKVLERVQNHGVTSTQLITRVGFITSQVVRDFTLRSDPAFGLYQLVKTWVDDYVSLYLLRQSALSSQSLDTPFSAPGNLNTMGMGMGMQGASGISVMIPAQPHTSFVNDLTTAVPFTQALNGYPQPHQNGSSAGGVGGGNSDVNPGFGLPPSQFLLAPTGFSGMDQSNGGGAGGGGGMAGSTPRA